MVVYLKSKAAPAVNNGTAAVDVASIVRGVIEDIRIRGDEAVRKYSTQFDKLSPESFRLLAQQIKDIISTVSEQTIDDIKTVQNNVKTFALAQRESLKDFELKIRPGVFLGQKNIPIGAVGSYVILLGNHSLI